MQLPNFVASLTATAKGAGRPLTAARAAEIVAARMADEAPALRDLNAKRVAYAAILATGATLDDPALERASRERDGAEKAYNRAVDARQVAESMLQRAQHAEKKAAVVARWANAAKIAAAYVETSDTFTAAAQELAKVKATLDQQRADLYAALPVEVASTPTFGPFSDGGRVQVELERVGLVRSRYQGTGFAPPEPLPDFVRGLGKRIAMELETAKADATGDTGDNTDG